MLSPPDWFHYPLVAFVTVATVIASQAIISGAFSLTQQAIQLGFLPRVSVLHTASDERGQIYVPLVNWALAAATLGAVVAFGSSDALAGAYGIAVSLLMAITTILAGLVAIQWGFNRVLVIGCKRFFSRYRSHLLCRKLHARPMFSLLLPPVAIKFPTLTWRGGQSLAERARSKMRESEDNFVAKLLPGSTRHAPARNRRVLDFRYGRDLADAHASSQAHLCSARTRPFSHSPDVGGAARSPRGPRSKSATFPPGSRVSFCDLASRNCRPFPTVFAKPRVPITLTAVHRQTLITLGERRSSQRSTFQECGYGAKRCMPSCCAMPSALLPISASRPFKLSRSDRDRAFEFPTCKSLRVRRPPAKTRSIFSSPQYPNHGFA